VTVDSAPDSGHLDCPVVDQLELRLSLAALWDGAEVDLIGGGVEQADLHGFAYGWVTAGNAAGNQSGNEKSADHQPLASGLWPLASGAARVGFPVFDMRASCGGTQELAALVSFRASLAAVKRQVRDSPGIHQ
jgi:hypothetical protein